MSKVARQPAPAPPPVEVPPADLLLIDAKGIFYRAADAYDELSVSPGEGFDPLYTGGIYGFLVIVLKMWAKTGGLVIVCWDDWKNGPSARKQISSTYKQREPLGSLPPDQQDFIKRMDAQMQILIELLSAIGVKQVVSWGWEADDVMGTLARRYNEHRVSIYSGDRDMFQCIDRSVNIIRPLVRGQVAVETLETVKAEFGVTPGQWIDWKSLVGDKGDNIPGCSGIGKIKAAQILQKFGTLKNAMKMGRSEWQNVGLSGKLFNTVFDQKDIIRLSWDLSRIRTDVELEFIPATLEWDKAKAMMLKMRFFTLLKPSRLDDLKRFAGI